MSYFCCVVPIRLASLALAVDMICVTGKLVWSMVRVKEDERRVKLPHVFTHFLSGVYCDPTSVANRVVVSLLPLSLFYLSKLHRNSDSRSLLY